MSRRARQDVRHLAHTMRVSQARRDRALFLIGRAALDGRLTVAEIAREAKVAPSTVRRWRDRAAESVMRAHTTAPDARADISAPPGRASGDEQEKALYALRALANGKCPPAVRTYASNRRHYRAPSVERVIALFGSWDAAVIAADLDPRPAGRPRKKAA